ncbi:MAG: riboflavin synthase [Solirubrobacteraceae bacterium]|jgi:riboflavin synthase|nr:riboflavin synthase [Solirubrobacteraceae bacterium]
MFTGLVQDLGRVAGAQSSGDGVRLAVATSLAPDIGEGDSVAVNGVCLTAVAVAPEQFEAEIMNETLRRSSLHEVREGAMVNLELPLRASDRLGGHVVQGHVDGVGAIVEIARDGFSRQIRITADEDVLRYIVLKGSIAVDGVSLTVSDIDDASFTVSLIPETLERTSLGGARVGTPVNLEVDVLAKYVEKLIGASR